MTINDILIGQAELRGERVGEKRAKEEVISRLIEKLHLTDEEIVEVAVAPISLVKKVRKKTTLVN